MTGTVQAMLRCAAAALVLVTGAVTSQATAQSLALGVDANSPIEIFADDGIEWQRANELYIARGNASARQGEVTVEADALTAFYRSGADGSNEIYRLDADGNVRITSDSEEALADKAVYDVTNGVLVLTGQLVTLNTAEDVITALDSVEYYQNEKLAVARGDATAVRGDRTVQADVLMAHFADPENDDAGGGGASSVDRIESVGNVRITTPTDVVLAARGDYSPDDGLATLAGDVRITRGENQLNGEFAEIDLNTGISRLLGDSTGSGRVGGLILPGAASSDQ